MKIDPHASLLAAQNLRTQDPSSRGRQASANFFAELQKASAKQQGTAKLQANPNPASAQTLSQPSRETPLREAPMRQIDPTRPMPPGSLLNILV